MLLPKTSARSVLPDPAAPTLAETRKEQICEAAVKLFAERGYADTKIEDISNAIGIAKGLVYRYFDDKLDLLFHALCHVVEKQRADVAHMMDVLGPLEALRQALRRQCEAADERTLELLLAYRTTRDLLPVQRERIKAVESSLVDKFSDCFDACVQNGLMRPFNSRNLGYQFLMYSHTWALKKWTLGRDFGIDQYIAEGEQLLLVPLLTEAGRARFAGTQAASGTAQRQRTGKAAAAKSRP